MGIWLPQYPIYRCEPNYLYTRSHNRLGGEAVVSQVHVAQPDRPSDPLVPVLVVLKGATQPYSFTWSETRGAILRYLLTSRLWLSDRTETPWLWVKQGVSVARPTAEPAGSPAVRGICPRETIAMDSSFHRWSRGYRCADRPKWSDCRARRWPSSWYGRNCRCWHCMRYCCCSSPALR